MQVRIIRNIWKIKEVWWVDLLPMGIVGGILIMWDDDRTRYVEYIRLSLLFLVCLRIRDVKIFGY